MPGAEKKEDLGAPARELVELARAELGEMSTRHRVEGFLEVNARRSPRRRQKRLVLNCAAVLATVALGVIGYRAVTMRDPGGLSYGVEGGRVDASGVIEANASAQPTLRFADGTEIVFLAGAHGRVKSVGEHGARIAMTGKVNVNVVHFRGSHWLFDAGPFLITVTGTSFTAEWREADERLEVTLASGAVAVSGPLSDDPIALRAGQRLIISMREKEVLIRDIGPAAAASVVASSTSGPPLGNADAEPPERPEALVAEKPDHGPGASIALPSPDTPPSWTAELAAGRFATILQQAEQRGLDKVIDEVSSDELAALSDAARYSRREDVARRTLAAQRRRFPKSARANDAAFLLGRLEETAGHPELALDWYERCLAGSTHGSYLSEALGRKMTLVQRLQGAARARPIAEEYLRRFGNGTYAAAARALIRAQ